MIANMLISGASLCTLLASAVPTSTLSTDAYTDRSAKREALCCQELDQELAKVVPAPKRSEAKRAGQCCEVKDKWLRAKYDSLDHGDVPWGGLGTSKESVATSPDNQRSYLGAMVQMVVMLTAICVMAYLILGRVLPRFLRGDRLQQARGIVNVVDRLPLDQRRSIVLLKIGKQYYMTGVTDTGITLLGRVDGEDVEQALALQHEPTTLRPGGRLKGLFSGYSSEER